MYTFVLTQTKSVTSSHAQHRPRTTLGFPGTAHTILVECGSRLSVVRRRWSSLITGASGAAVHTRTTPYTAVLWSSYSRKRAMTIACFCDCNSSSHNGRQRFFCLARCVYSRPADKKKKAYTIFK